MAFERLCSFTSETRTHSFGGPGIRAPQDDLARGHVLACRNPKTRFAGIELRDASGFLGGVETVPVRRMPDVAMTRVQEHTIPFTDRSNALVPDHRPDIVGGDDSRIARTGLFGDGQLASAQSYRVEQHTTADETDFRHVFHTQWSHTVTRNTRIRQIAAVIEKVALRCPYANVSRTVELRADLADLRAEVFVVIHQRLFSERTASRQTRDRHTPSSRAECRCVLCIYFPECGNLAAFYEPGRFQDHFRCRPIERSRHVIRPPFAGSPTFCKWFIVDRHGASRRYSDKNPGRDQ